MERRHRQRDLLSDWRQPAAAEYAQTRADHVAKRDRFSRIAKRFSDKAEAENASIAALDAAAQAFGLMLNIDVDRLDADIRAVELQRSGPLFKDVALRLLKEAYPKPLRAAEVQKLAEAELGRKFHSKTPGMSLYRLAQDGMVERRGWDWFFVPEERQAVLKRARATILGEEDQEEIMAQTK
jgi:hypothetical protein